MLEIRPNCECCDKDLSPDAQDAMICTYECTFCSKCIEEVLDNVCPNCGGGFVPRPIRPKKSWRPTTGLSKHPASQSRVLTKYTKEELKQFSRKLRDIAPADR